MTLLLDTHALLWWLDDTNLASATRVRIADPDEIVLVSAVTLWEVAIKCAIGKLEVDGPMIDQLTENGFGPLPISWEHAQRAGALPPHHRDPFDRMLVAQAQAESLTLVTRDPAFDAYEVELLRC